MGDMTRKPDDGRLDQAFERIVASQGARLDQDSIIRLLVLLANSIAIQRETLEILTDVAAGEIDAASIEDIANRVDESRDNFEALVVDIANASVEPA